MKAKRIGALALALALCLSLGAFADTSTTATVPVTLTVDNEYRAVNVTYAFFLASFRSFPFAVIPRTRPPFVTICPFSNFVPAWKQ